MPTTTVNPTRMGYAPQGAAAYRPAWHKLLKDKRDELMKQFMEVVREDLALRQKVEQSLARAYGSFTVASALMSPEMLEQALLCPKQSVFSRNEHRECDER